MTTGTTTTAATTTATGTHEAYSLPVLQPHLRCLDHQTSFFIVSLSTVTLGWPNCISIYATPRMAVMYVSMCHLKVPRKRLHHLYTVFYTLRGSANWCTGKNIKGISKKVYSDNADCEKACTDNADCHFYGRRHRDNMCEFWEADECGGGDYISAKVHSIYAEHSVYQKHYGLCWLSRV